MSEYLLVFDIGTSGTKAALYSTDGTLAKSTTHSYEVRYSHDTAWAEEDPADWWQAVTRGCRELLQDTAPASILSVSFSGQMSGACFLGKDGRCVRPHILWGDTRSARETRELQQQLDAEKTLETMGRMPSGFGLAERLLWLKRNEPDTLRQTDKIIQAKDYIAYKMTGRVATDYTDASATYLLDRKRLCWNDESFQMLGVPVSLMPEPVPSTARIGSVSASAAAQTGLLEGTPVIIGAGDVAASAVGAGCLRTGNIHVSIGSSGWCAITSDHQHPDYDKFYSVLHAVPGLYVNEMTLNTAGLAYKWMADTICTAEREQALANGQSLYTLINDQIEHNCAGAHGILFLPFLAGGNSFEKNLLASGAFLGLRTSTSRADLLRAVPEGVCYSIAQIAKEFMKTEEITGDIIIIGGGAKGKIWNTILCDILGKPCRVARYPEESASIGAAIIGGIGTEIFDSYSAAETFIKYLPVQEPDAENHAYYRTRMPVFEKAYREISGIYPDL